MRIPCNFVKCLFCKHSDCLTGQAAKYGYGAYLFHNKMMEQAVDIDEREETRQNAPPL